MFKIISFELRKLVSRIGIYILTALMAILLVASVFMYDPIERTTESPTLIGDTVVDMYSNFNAIKGDYILAVDNIAQNASTYVIDSENYEATNSASYIKGLFTEFDTYCLTYKETQATQTDYNLLLTGIKQSLQNLKSALDKGLNHSINKTGFYMLATEQVRTNLYNIISQVSANFTSPASHKIAGEKYYNEYRTDLNNYLQQLIYPNLNNTAIKYTPDGAYYTIITLRMSEIDSKINKIYTNAVEDEIINMSQSSKNELNTLFNRYVNCGLIFEKAYNSSMCVDALYSVKSKSQRTNLVGYSDISLYEQEEMSVEYKYYIENHTNENDYANSLSMTHSSNAKANAYDFTYYTMSLFAIIVVVFAIYLSAHTISGEIHNNTMRFTALRPVKRGSIFMGKYLAILFMCFIMLLFGTITSFIVGGITLGFESASILTIINGTYVFVTHPLAVLGLFVLSLFLVIAFYSALTMALSSLLKSDLLAMIISVIVYATNLILPLFFKAGSWLRFNPLTNINIFAYFGSTRLSSTNVLGKMFNNIVYHGMNLWISLAYIVGITTILLVIGKIVFKRREL